MDDVRNIVARYLYHDCKTIICAVFGIDYELVYERVTVYRLSSPHTFVQLLCEDTANCDCPIVVDDRTWDALIRAIPDELPTHARYRCLQAVVEYGAALVLPFIDFFVKISDEKDRNEMRSALAFYYEPFHHRTCEWMKAVATFDNMLFQQMIYRIISGCVSPRTGAAFKRSLVYARQISSATTKHVYLDGVNEKPARLLWKLRRAYEHILFGRFHVDDMTSRDAPLQALLDPSKAYTHSSFDCDGASGGRQLVVTGCRNLTLCALPNKPFPYHHYRGALELISSCGDDLSVVYCDKRLGHHHLLDPEDFIFDPPSILLGLPSVQTALERTERLTMRISDFSSGGFGGDGTKKNAYQSNVTENEFCHKAYLLQPTNDSQYESDVLSVACHVKDFLLWVISENPTLRLTR